MEMDQLLPTPREAMSRGNASRDRGKGNIEDWVAQGRDSLGRKKQRKKGGNQRNPSTEGEQLTFSQVDFLANRFPLPGSKEARQMTVTSGQKCLELYRKQSPVGLLVRMCLESSIWDSKLRYLIWKEKVTKWNYSYYLLHLSAVGTKGLGSGLWHTPTAIQVPSRGTEAMLKKQKKRNESGRNTVPAGTLQKQVMMSGDKPISDMRQSQMYPTPTVGCVEGGEQSGRVEKTKKGGYILRKKGKKHMTYGAKLSDAILYEEKKREMFPTPTAAEGTKIGSRANYGQVGLSNHPDIVGLPTRPKMNKSRKGEKMWHTPRATDSNTPSMVRVEKMRENIPTVGQLREQAFATGTDKIGIKEGGQLNPNWVTWLMGYPPNWVDLE